MFKQLFARSPKSYRAHIEPGGVTVDVGRRETLLQAALRQGVDFPHDCEAGSCTTCKCRLLEGDATSLQDPAYVLEPSEIQAGYILACQTLARM